MVLEGIKERESFILNLHSMEIQIDSRIAQNLNSSLMISSILNKLIICIAQKGRSHLLLCDKK